MRTKFVGLAITLLFSACTSYVQVFDTQTTNTTAENDLYVYEDNFVKISYGFWADHGLMAFYIYNKADKPLYIDWKKSSYIDNSTKLNYWIDEETTKSSVYFGEYFNYGPPKYIAYALNMPVFKSVSSTVRPERVTFIPPASNYSRSQFYILPINFFKLDTKVDFKEVPRTDNPNKRTKVYEKSYTKSNSPLIFRNYLTFSHSEDFSSEFHVDNEFYISEIKEMDTRHFRYYKYDETKPGRFMLKDDKGNPIMFSNFKKESSFYLYVPKNGTIKYRK